MITATGVEPSPVGAAEQGNLAAALERVGDRWSLLVVSALLEGPRRFTDLQEEVPGVATNILAGRLRELERSGLVVAEPYSHRPLRLEYRATARAAELAAVLRHLAHWGGGGEGADPAVHVRCGTTLEVRYFCPTCRELVDGEADIWL